MPGENNVEKDKYFVAICKLQSLRRRARRACTLFAVVICFWRVRTDLEGEREREEEGVSRRRETEETEETEEKVTRAPSRCSGCWRCGASAAAAVCRGGGCRRLRGAWAPGRAYCKRSLARPRGRAPRTLTQGGKHLSALYPAVYPRAAYVWPAFLRSGSGFIGQLSVMQVSVYYSCLVSSIPRCTSLHQAAGAGAAPVPAVHHRLDVLAWRWRPSRRPRD